MKKHRVVKIYLRKWRGWTWKSIDNILNLSKEVSERFNKGKVRMDLNNFTTKKLITCDKHIFEIMVTINNTILVIYLVIFIRWLCFLLATVKHKTVIGIFCNTIFTFKFTKISFAISTYMVIPMVFGIK